MYFNSSIIIFGVLFFFIGSSFLIYFFYNHFSFYKKPIREFSDFDLTHMDDFILRIHVMLIVMRGLLVIMLLIPGLYLLYIGIRLLDPKLSTKKLSNWEKSNLLLLFIIIILLSFLLLIWCGFSTYRLIDFYKQSITIKSSELFVKTLHTSFTVKVQDIQKVVSFERGFNSNFGNIVRSITIKSIQGDSIIIKTGNFEAWEILKLIAYLNAIAIDKNTNLTMNDFFKRKWI